ncbi:heparin lyase I family protein [Adhaeribacter swui]|uniref:Heparin lyase I family protein n=1 Tax=Adhaeribacter swui TaxID=2086471 RepID=A0A7G7GC37_9BACT|nr:polysaccharide lyase [Adhaeribacter swui]QNF34721.1 heparin lyase I family protein [Adhaeribacter swui]
MKTKLLFSISLLSLFTVACETEEIVEPKEVARLTSGIEDLSYITSADKNRRNLVAEERIEPSLSGAFGRQIYTSYGFGATTSVSRSGSRSARLELRKEGSAVRSEIIFNKPTPSHGWYGMSLYMPSGNWQTEKDGDGWDIITQFHGTPDSGDGSRVPPISMSVIQGRLVLTVNYSSKRYNKNPDGRKRFDLGPVVKDKWVDFVYHIKYSYKSDGKLELWKNGSKVVSYTGPNTYNDAVTPYLKMGVYKRNWDYVSKRVIYVDDVRIGDGNSSYADVAPSGSGSSQPVDQPTSPSPSPTPTDNTSGTSGQQVVSFTLINADTDRDIKTISNGETLDLSNLPTRNLNIRANTNTTVGSVYFALSGAKSFTKVEGGAPYALFGDTNLNYAAWRPAVGSYTLKATPYSGTNKSGSAGTSLTVSFKVQE